MLPALQIRPERPEDRRAVFAVHSAAFPSEAEARLVEALRAHGKAIVSLVAEQAGEVVGHILFSPVTVDGVGGGLGLAPLAVLPNVQRTGIGTRLGEAGLEACRQGGWPFAVVLGGPAYYARFGFVRASRYGLGNEYGEDEAFQVLALVPGGVPAGGLVRYADEFADLG